MDGSSVGVVGPIIEGSVPAFAHLEEARRAGSIVVDDDRYPLSPRIQMLKGILGKIRP